MNLWEEMAADGDEFLSTFGKPIVFRGKTRLALINTSPVDQLMQDGGFVYRAYYRLRILAKDTDQLRREPPEQGEQVEVYGRPYTITGVTNRPPSPWIDLNVQSSTQ